jgi:hypothetical protein
LACAFYCRDTVRDISLGLHMSMARLIFIWSVQLVQQFEIRVTFGRMGLIISDYCNPEKVSFERLERVLVGLVPHVETCLLIHDEAEVVLRELVVSGERMNFEVLIMQAYKSLVPNLHYFMNFWRDFKLVEFKLLVKPMRTIFNCGKTRYEVVTNLNECLLRRYFVKYMLL